MHRDTDRPGLIRDAPGDRLADPPRRVGRELIAPAVLELLHRLHQAHVPLLDQVEERETAVGVLLGNRNDQSQVRLDHLGLGPHRLAHPLPQIPVMGKKLILGQSCGMLQLLNLLLQRPLAHIVGPTARLGLVQRFQFGSLVLKLLVHVIANRNEFLQHLLLEKEFGE